MFFDASGEYASGQLRVHERKWAAAQIATGGCFAGRGMSTVSSILDRAGFAVLLLAAAVAPIPFGSNSPSLAGCLGLLLALCLLASAIVPKVNQAVARLYGVALLMAIVVVLSAVVQTTPWGHAALMSPIWHQSARFIGDPGGVVSASRYQPLHSVGYVLLAIAAFTCALVYVRGESRFMTFLHVLLFSGSAVTLFCLVQYSQAPNSLLWADKKHYIGSFTGTFINPNTAATYFGVMLLLSIAVGLRQLDGVDLTRLLLAGSRWSLHERRRLKAFLIYGVAAFIFSMALLLTKSRAGIASSLAGVALFTAILVFQLLRRRASALAAAAVTFLCLLGGAALFMLFGGLVMRRLEVEGLSDAARLCVYQSTWRAIETNFWHGTGLGTFQDVLPSYRLPACNLYGYWDTAHNFFLEGWLGFGAVFLACTSLAYYKLLQTFMHGMRERRRLRFVPLACLCLLVVVTLHSLLDFSMQIPGVSVTVAATLGAGCAISLTRGG
jgi:O-antigen ligase